MAGIEKFLFGRRPLTRDQVQKLNLRQNKTSCSSTRPHIPPSEHFLLRPASPVHFPSPVTMQPAFVPSASLRLWPATAAVSPLALSSSCSRFAPRVTAPAPRRASALRMMTSEPSATVETATTDAPTAEAPAVETFQFQAEVSRTMSIIINSLYSNKDVFLRELVSNAADACDKRRFLALSNDEAATQADIVIRVKADKDARTVTIEDAGVGMTRQELINNLGSIATSGTAKFAEAIGQNNDDVSLIGQFGVGFYSAYLVADKVTVTTRSFTDSSSKQYTWESNADSSYTIREDSPDAEPLFGSSGTRIVLHLKDTSSEYLESFKIEELLRRYSEFISFPIQTWQEKTEMEEIADGDEKDDEGNQKMKRVPKTVADWSQINTLQPIWMRRPREVLKEEYVEFYKTIAKDFNDPAGYSHFAVEGDIEFRAILFAPKTIPMELRQNMFDESGRMLKLYVKRVFISDSFEDILPRWLSFVRGVIDSDDLPLNVSREILQKSRVLRVISKRLIRKSLDMFSEIKKRDNNDYSDFWKEFGRYLKAGIVEGQDYIEDLSRLSLWPSTNDRTALTSLDDYVSRAKDGQDVIYYVAASSRSAAEAQPAMEKLRSLNYEVLFLVEPVDEIAVQNMVSYKAKIPSTAEDATEGTTEEKTFKFVDVSKDDLDLGNLKSEDDKKNDEKVAEDYTSTVAFLTTLLKDKVGKVRVTDRLTESASTITQSSFGLSPTMERYMKEVGAGGMSDPSMNSYLTQSRTLDINPAHPIIVDIKTRLESEAGETDEAVRQTAMLVYELACLTGGYDVDDTAAFARRVSSLVSSAVTAPSVPMPEQTPKSDNSTGSEGPLTTESIMQAINDAGVDKADVEIVE
jgi:molecular chaperone HtpG